LSPSALKSADRGRLKAVFTTKLSLFFADETETAANSVIQARRNRYARQADVFTSLTCVIEKLEDRREDADKAPRSCGRTFSCAQGGQDSSRHSAVP